MSEVFVNIKGLDEVIDREYVYASQIEEIRIAASVIRRNLRTRSPSMRQVSRKLDQLVKVMESEKMAMKSMNTALGQVKEIYLETESRLAGIDYSKIGNSNAWNKEKGKYGWLDFFVDYITDLTPEIVKDFGYIGAISKFTIAGEKELPKWNDYLKMITCAVGIMSDVEPDDVDSGPLVALEGLLSDKKIDVENIFCDNVKENVGLHTSKFWQNFLTESVIDSGKGILLTSTVSLLEELVRGTMTEVVAEKAGMMTMVSEVVHCAARWFSLQVGNVAADVDKTPQVTWAFG